MSVRNRLNSIRYILVKLTEREDCAAITGYDKTAINIFIEALDRVVERYKSESNRVCKSQRSHYK